MARGRKKKEKVERVIKIKPSEFRAAINEASRLKEQSSSYSGFHGRHVKTFVERTGFSRHAFAVISKMEKLGDDLKRQSLMDEIIMGFDLMGWNDQGNLFDRVTAKLENDVEKEEGESEEDEDVDVRPSFLQNAMPLDEAKEKFDAALEVAEAKKAVAAKAKAAKPDALSALTAEEPATAH
ncbi:hypothetical protein [Labrys sp. ZIDIC5]|uniref:hypothetical protein n=1 Tax=Labrys sedimenti TaxID=3106036 RepID=UPI002ACB0289|nr:hypothetical protein [Labrys sp. ZIDIC5]MDZ5448908.1 hypothetical protein [Labrys sp. ZIDIC5]